MSLTSHNNKFYKITPKIIEYDNYPIHVGHKTTHINKINLDEWIPMLSKQKIILWLNKVI